MAITHDNSTSSQGSGSTSHSHTSASSAFMIAGITVNTSSVSSWDEVSYNSSALTFLSEIVANNRTQRMYYHSSPASGSNTFVVDHGSGSTTHTHVTTVTGHDTGDPIGINDTNNGSSNNPWVSITLENDDSWTYQHFFYNSTATSVTSANDGQTQRTYESGGVRSYGYTNDSPATAGSTTQDYTLDDNKGWNISIAEINAAAEAGAGTTPYYYTNLLSREN